jgi:ABC-2 type transport system permease protein
MSKLGIIIKREYLVRVTHKLFLISTFVAPLAISLLMIIPIMAAFTAGKEKLTVYVVENGTGIVKHLSGDESVSFEASTEQVETLKKSAAENKETAVLVIPEDLSRQQLTATYFASRAPSLKAETTVEKALVKAVRKLRLIKEGVTPEKLAAAEVNLELTTKTISKEGEKEGSALLAFIIGQAMALLIYMMLAIYGQIVMQGVMEEKTNRIMEVMISSVKPVELMLGKIVSIGLVGLTQLLLWIGLVWVLSLGVFVIALPLMNIQVPEIDPGNLEGPVASAFKIKQAIDSFNGWMLPLFVLFFIGGFFIYGSLFAAVGSAVDQPQDASNLAFIPVLPLLVPILVLNPIVSNPNGALAFWLSMIPLFSPTVMMVRVAAGAVSLDSWELWLSLLLLVGGVALFTWISARIYRVGVLLYGKKVTFGELVKWVVAKT